MTVSGDRIFQALRIIENTRLSGARYVCSVLKRHKCLFRKLKIII